MTVFFRNAAAVQPILLVLEDLHWSDRGTLDYLLHLARNLAGARLLVIGTYRDVEVDRAHPLSSALAELRRAGDLPRVVLRGLTVDEVHRMINALHGHEVRWSLAEMVHRQTEGSPLFIQEVLRYFAEQGLIVHTEGRWHRAGEAPPELSIPEGLRDVIGKRLSRLSPECNRLLTVAAVIGREFRLDVLGRVSRVGEDDALASLEEGLKLGVLEEQARVGGVLYRFSHAFFRQTLYEELSAARRIRLHQEVGRALEEVHARWLDDHAPELAQHFSHSSDPSDLSKAVHYGELGARRAIGVYAHGEAVRLLERAIEVQEVLDPDDRSRRCDLLLLLGDALMASGEPQRVAEAIAPEVLALAEELGDEARASTGCRMALTALNRYGGAAAWQTDEFHRWVGHADRYASPGGLDRIHADVALYLAARSSSQDRHRFAARALELARSLGTPEALFQAATPVLDPMAPLGEDERYRVARELAASGREGVSGYTLAHDLYLGAVALLNHGDRDAAEALWTEIEDLGSRTRDTYVQLRGPFIATVRATLDGHLEGALDAARTLRERADELGSTAFGRRWGTLLTERPLLYLGRGEEFVSAFTAVPNAPQRGALLPLAYLGRAAQCRQGIESFLQRLDEGGPGRDGTIVALEAAVTIGDLDHALLLADRLARMAGPSVIGNPEQSCTSVGRVLGAAAALAGELDEAEDYCRQALAVCERARFRPEIALIRLQLAEVLSAKAAKLGADALTPPQGEGGSSAPKRWPTSTSPSRSSRP